MALVTADELARELRCSRSTVYELARRGMPHLQLGRKRGFRFDHEAALAWLAEHAERKRADGLRSEADKVGRALRGGGVWR